MNPKIVLKPDITSSPTACEPCDEHSARTTFPLIKEVQTQKDLYLFDGKTGRLFKVTPCMQDLIRGYDGDQLAVKYSDKERAKVTGAIQSLVENQILLPGPLMRRGSPPSEDYLRNELSQSLPSITLELTDACNMRCVYCAYSGGYTENRVHGNTCMSIDVARAAIDFFHDRAHPIDDKRNIGLYGGEPLLAFGVLKDCVLYARQMPDFTVDNLRIGVTTNGTLLTEEMIGFFIDNRVSLTISIDGPQSEHDRFRVLKNGKGTFDTVFSNVKKIHQMAPDYFREHVSFNCISSPSTNLLALHDFFAKYEYLFGDEKITPTSVSLGNPDFFKTYPERPTGADEFRALFETYISSVLGKATPSMCLIRPLFETNLVKIHRRSKYTHGTSVINILPTCLPGKRKLFVSVDGKLHICERINQTMPIGDVQSGFNFKQIATLMRSYYELMNQEDCLSCWAVRLCDVCCASITGEKIFSLAKKAGACARLKDSMEGALTTYCEVLERKPHAFDFMDSYMIK